MEKEQHPAHRKLQKILNSTRKILQWQVMNKKLNSNSMEHVQKHFSFNSTKGSNPSEVFLKISRLFFELVL